MQTETEGPAHSWKKLEVIVGRGGTAPGTTWKQKHHILNLWNKHFTFSLQTFQSFQKLWNLKKLFCTLYCIVVV